MITTILIIIYLFFCLLVAIAGKEVTVGFWGVLIISIFFTPLLTALAIILFRPTVKKEKYD